MKKRCLLIMALLMSLFLCACSTEAENVTVKETEETVIVETAESTVETTEPEIIPEPEWFSEDVIDEAIDCLFPLEGEIDVGLAQELLLPLVENGNAEAQYYWGYIFDWLIVDNDGEGEKESLYWFELAAEQGFPKAYLATALNEYTDSGEKTDELLEKATQAGVFDLLPEELGADGCVYIACYYRDKKDYRTAMDWYKKAAELGSTIAMAEIGYMYYEGQGVTRDYVTSLDWLLQAANKGNADAMYLYGFVLCQDKVKSELIKQANYSTEQDILNTATEWFKKAASLGHATAMNDIGFYNYDEQGAYEKAREWYKKAASKGNATAMNNLAYSYYTHVVLYSGDTYPYASYNEAMAWLIKAYANGNDNAASGINHMLSRGAGVDAYFKNYAELVFANP